MAIALNLEAELALASSLVVLVCLVVVLLICSFLIFIWLNSNKISTQESCVVVLQFCLCFQFPRCFGFVVWRALGVSSA